MYNSVIDAKGIYHEEILFNMLLAESEISRNTAMADVKEKNAIV